MQGAVLADARCLAEGFPEVEENDELEFGHFARGESEFLVLNGAAALYMALDGDVVRRIEKRHSRFIALHDPVDVGGRSRVAAPNSMLREPPQIAALRYRPQWWVWNRLFDLITLWHRRRGSVCIDLVHLVDLEPGDRDIEIDVELWQKLGELAAQGFIFFGGVFSELARLRLVIEGTRALGARQAKTAKAGARLHHADSAPKAIDAAQQLVHAGICPWRGTDESVSGKLKSD
jgi:hypothetical protein